MLIHSTPQYHTINATPDSQFYLFSTPTFPTQSLLLPTSNPQFPQTAQYLKLTKHLSALPCKVNSAGGIQEVEPVLSTSGWAKSKPLSWAFLNLKMPLT